GLMSITGEEGGRAPVKVGVPLTDLTCALYGAVAALAALRVRERTGRGQFIDVCLLEAGVSLALWEAGRYFATGEIPRALGSARPASLAARSRPTTRCSMIRTSPRAGSFPRRRTQSWAR